MKSSLKSTLEQAINSWISEQYGHDARPSGLTCEDLSDMMADAAAAVYDASHAGSIAGAKDPDSCGVVATA